MFLKELVIEVKVRTKTTPMQIKEAVNRVLLL
jgi:hypothetical protein